MFSLCLDNPNSSNRQAISEEPSSPSISHVRNEAYGVLIGIDVYDQGNATRRATDGHVIKYANLRGCMQDALAIEQYLRGTFGVKDSNIVKLLANHPALSDQCSGARAPTYNNIYEAFEAFIEIPGSEKIPKAKAGDKVLIHYSGHGARATTIFPALKDGTKFDEALVPCDILTGGRYLRDVELAFLLRKMVDRGLLVTVVLDCCHSGSATRGTGNRQVRGIVDIYQSHPMDDRPPPNHEIAKLYPVNGAVYAADITLLREPLGYTVFAACRQNEFAWEDELENGIIHGALTYWLLDTLRCSGGTTVSSAMLYRRVCAMVRNWFVDQTPMLSGETNRLFFDAGDVLPDEALVVQRVNRTSVELSGGTLHGARIGAEYCILPYNTELRNPQVMKSSQLCVATVQSTELLKSNATFDDLKEGSSMISPGCKAVLISIPLNQKALFRLSQPDTQLEAEFKRVCKQEVFRNWLDLTSVDEPTLKYIIAVNKQNEYEIKNRYEKEIAGIIPLLPAIKVTDPDTVPRLAYRMRHLTYYNILKDLENANQISVLRGGITFEVLGQTSSDPADMGYEALEEKGGCVEVDDGTCILVRLLNTTPFTVNFTILNLRPLFGIDHSLQSSDFEYLDPGAKTLLKFEMEIPEALKPFVSSVPVIDILKAFITLDPIFLRLLCLDDLDQAEKKRSRGAEPFNALQNLLERLVPQHRNARYLCSEPATNWQTMSLQIRTLPKPRQ
jgi:hypothetical protein